ncbi:MAG: hypothetical protein Q4G59_11775 [Planctomycetia bacterium]|nr:hypothetical protein [Planctomycetia bacterium]
MSSDKISDNENNSTPENKQTESLPELPGQPSKPKRPIWLEILVAIMLICVVVGLCLPTRTPVPPKVVYYLKDDSPKDRTLRAVVEGMGRLPAKQRITISDSTQVKVKVPICELSAPGEPKNEGQLVKVHQLVPVKIIGPTVHLLCIYDFGRNNAIIRRFVPEYDLWIPVAYYKLPDGRNRVYSTHVFSGPINAKYKDSFKQEFGREWDMTNEDDWYYIDLYRVKEAIKTKTNDELTADVEKIIAEAPKFPTHQESERLQKEWLQEEAKPVN